MKTKKLMGITALIICALMMGCISKKEIEKGKADVKKPINCATAVQDIANLEKEKARVGQEIVAGATSIVPIGAVLHVLQLKERDDLEVGCGEYNHMIDKKIAEIKKECINETK